MKIELKAEEKVTEVSFTRYKYDPENEKVSLSIETKIEYEKTDIANILDFVFPNVGKDEVLEGTAYYSVLRYDKKKNCYVNDYFTPKIKFTKRELIEGKHDQIFIEGGIIQDLWSVSVNNTESKYEQVNKVDEITINYTTLIK